MVSLSLMRVGLEAFSNVMQLVQARGAMLARSSCRSSSSSSRSRLGLLCGRLAEGLVTLLQRQLRRWVSSSLLLNREASGIQAQMSHTAGIRVHRGGPLTLRPGGERAICHFLLCFSGRFFIL